MPGIDACLEEAMSLPGARGAAIVDWTSGLALGTAGESPNGDHEATAAETAEIARAAAEYSAFAPVERPTRPARPALALPAGPMATARALPPGLGPVPPPSPAGPPPPPVARPASAPPSAGPPGTPGTPRTPGNEKGPPVEDLIVTTRTGYHILSFVETTFDSSVFLHLWLDRESGNLALARIRLRRLAERLVLG